MGNPYLNLHYQFLLDYHNPYILHPSSTIPKMDVIYMDYDNLAKIDNANSNMDNNLQESNASKIEDWEKKEHEWIENLQSQLHHSPPALPQIEYTHTHAQPPFQQPSQLHHSPPTLPQIEYTHTHNHLLNYIIHHLHYHHTL